MSDGLGNLYIADYTYNEIRKLVLATGQVTTYARGSYNFGFADGWLNTAIFAGPWDIGYDGNGHLYVADAGNFLIRRIDIATQMVSTVVGTPNGASGVILGRLATARLNTPVGLAVLPGGTGVAIASRASAPDRGVLIGDPLVRGPRLHALSRQRRLWGPNRPCSAGGSLTLVPLPPGCHDMRALPSRRRIATGRRGLSRLDVTSRNASTFDASPRRATVYVEAPRDGSNPAGVAVLFERLSQFR